MSLRYYLRGLGIGIAVTAVVMGFTLNNKTEVELSDSEIIARAENLGMVMEEKTLIKKEEIPEKNQQETIEFLPEDVKTTEENSDNDAVAEETLEDENLASDGQSDESEAEEEAAKKKAEEEAAKKKAEEEAAKKKAEEEAAKKKAEEEAAKKKAEEEAAKKKAEEETAKKKAEEEAARKKAEEEAAKKKAEEEAAKKKAEDAKKNETLKNNGTLIIVTVKPGSGSETISKQLYDAGLVDNATSFNAYLCSGGYDKRLTTGAHSVPQGSSYAEIAKIMTR